MTTEQPSSPGEGLRPEDRLRRGRDFLRCYRQGRRVHGALAVLHYHPNEEGRPRLGITASRKVGNAVARHRFKRRIREVFRRWPRRWEVGGWDLVVHLRRGMKDPGSDPFRGEICDLLEDFLAATRRTRNDRCEGTR